MPAFLLKLVPFRDWLYAALAIALGIAWYVHNQHMITEGEQREQIAVVAASAKATAVAQKAIDKLTTAHVIEVANIEDNYEHIIQADDTASAADLQRLRERAGSDSHPNQVLESASGDKSTPAAGASDSGSLGTVPAEQALSLADALRADDAALVKCYADRDSLTGK